MSIARFAVAAIVLLTGCASIRGLLAGSTEELLAAAGFKKELIDAVESEDIEATPPHRLVTRVRNGAVQYSYADPDRCQCVYVGGPKEYAEYQRLAAERRRDEERWRAAENIWDRPYWGLVLR